MTPESVQAMIDQALLRNSTNRDGSHSSHEDNRWNVQTTRPCFYADFMKCQPLNFKGTEGVNSQIRSLGPDAYSMTWEVLKKKITDKYYPQGEVKKLEIELWNLKVKGNDVPAYTEQRKTNHKRKADESFRNKHGHQQQPLKRQNVAKVYNMGTGKKKPYNGNFPKCTKCHFYDNGPCTQKCHKCNKDYTSAITPDESVPSTEEPDNSLSLGDEHLDTISATESDEFIKSSIENLIPIPTLPPDFELVSSEEMEIVIPEVGGIEASNDDPILFYDTIISGTSPNLTPSGEEAFLNDDHSSDFKTKSSFTSLNSLLEETNNFNNSLPEFTTFSKVLFDAEYESDSSDDQSCSDEDVLEKIVLKPLCEEEIIPMESLRTHDSSLLISFKIDSLLDEFAGELTLLKSISPRINLADSDFEEDIRLIKKLLYDNSSSRPPEEFFSANSDAKIKSFSPSPILVKDSDFLMEEVDLLCTPDYPMPSGIVDEDYDSERDILIRKDLPSNNPFHLLKKSHSILIFLCFLVLLQNHQMVIQEF
nr:hypothetical protein [Tanacetum cinerariifolium]